MPEDIQILRDVTVDGVRHITAVPSALVCSRQIDFDLVDGTIRNLRYTAGCHGNLQALGALLEGQPVPSHRYQLQGTRHFLLRPAHARVAGGVVAACHFWKIILSLHPGIEMWCNGSTRDFGSLS